MSEDDVGAGLFLFSKNGKPIGEIQMKKMKMSLLSIAMLLISIVFVACQTGESST